MMQHKGPADLHGISGLDPVVFSDLWPGHNCTLACNGSVDSCDIKFAAECSILYPSCWARNPSAILQCTLSSFVGRQR